MRQAGGIVAIWVKEEASRSDERKKATRRADGDEVRW